jgi:hypothetical protein
MNFAEAVHRHCNDDESGPELTAPNGVTDERNSTPPLHLIK